MLISKVNSTLLSPNSNRTDVILVHFLGKINKLVLLGLNIVVFVKKLAYLNVVFLFDNRDDSFERRSVPAVLVLDIPLQLFTESTLELELVQVISLLTLEGLASNLAVGAANYLS